MCNPCRKEEHQHMKDEVRNDRNQNAVQAKSGPVGWRTVLLVEIRSRFDGQNRGILLGGDKTGSNHRLLMGWWRRKKNFYLGLTLYLRQEGELYFLLYHSLGFQDPELRLTLLELNSTWGLKTNTTGVIVLLVWKPNPIYNTLNTVYYVINKWLKMNMRNTNNTWTKITHSSVLDLMHN